MQIAFSGRIPYTLKMASKAAGARRIGSGSPRRSAASGGPRRSLRAGPSRFVRQAARHEAERALPERPVTSSMTRLPTLPRRAGATLHRAARSCAADREPSILPRRDAAAGPQPPFDHRTHRVENFAACRAPRHWLRAYAGQGQHRDAARTSFTRPARDSACAAAARSSRHSRGTDSDRGVRREFSRPSRSPSSRRSHRGAPSGRQPRPPPPARRPFSASTRLRRLSDPRSHGRCLDGRPHSSIAPSNFGPRPSPQTPS